MLNDADDEDGQPWAPARPVMIKNAAAESGYSESGIRSMIDRGIVDARTRGGRVWVDADDIPRKKVRKNVLRTF